MIPCDLCGGAGRELVAATDEVWRHVACGPCGLVWVDPLPDLAGLNSKIYGGAARPADDEAPRGPARSDRLAREVARLGRPGRTQGGRPLVPVRDPLA